MYCTAERLINATWATLLIFPLDYFLTMNWELPIGPSATGPWELIYKEEYSTKVAAMQREKELKSGVGREFIRKNILKDI
jgi:hypothetical protein